MNTNTIISNITRTINAINSGNTVRYLLGLKKKAEKGMDIEGIMIADMDAGTMPTCHMTELQDLFQSITEDKTMNNEFKTHLELTLIAYLDSGSVSEQVAQNLNQSEDFDDLEGRLIAYLDSDMITEEFGHNMLSSMTKFSA